MSTTSQPHRIGVYGGTFDPPHLGHLILAETAADSLALDRVLFAPAGDPPHKDVASIRAPIAHRVAMVERAISSNARFALSRVDVDRPGPHYSVDMLRYLQRMYEGTTLIFLIGADSLADLPTWSRPAELLAVTMLGVMRRPGTAPDLSTLKQQFPHIDDRIEWVDAPLIDISARDLAARIAAGRSVRYQIPDTVRAYITEHNLYRNELYRNE